SQPHLAGDRIITLINHPRTLASTPMATITSLRQALRAVADRMDRAQDVLFLYLSSHGSDEHEFALTLEGLTLSGLRPDTLQSLLQESGIQWKVIVISACYSGGFIPFLEDET